MARWLTLLTKTIALSSSLSPRLLGISLASLSSGMGELTFLQLTTTLPTEATSKTALGAWSSGTGFAGVAGAGIWWLLRGLGVKGGLGLSSVSQTHSICSHRITCGEELRELTDFVYSFYHCFFQLHTNTSCLPFLILRLLQTHPLINGFQHLHHYRIITIFGLLQSSSQCHHPSMSHNIRLSYLPGLSIETETGTGMERN